MKDHTWVGSGPGQSRLLDHCGVATISRLLKIIGLF